MKTLSKGPFLGINNRLPDFGMHKPKEGDFLRTAINVDVDDSGSLRRRAAAVRVQAMTGAHSLFNGHLVRDSVLYRIALPTYSETMLKVLTSNAAMSYAEYNGDIYFSNGTDSGRITQDGAVLPWAMPTPAAPAVSSVGGDLFAGKYQVVVSYANATTGEEGGVSYPTQYQLSDVGGLRVTLPGAVAGATHIRVYVSAVNGSVPFLAGSFAVGTPVADIIVAATGRDASVRNEVPLPAGTRIFMFNGCLCSIKGNDWFIGLPSRPGYRLDIGSRVPFPAPISVAVSNQGGAYIVADRTYFFAGTDPASIDEVRDILPYGAVAGTEFEPPNKSLVGWFGAKGVVLADAFGEVQTPMTDNIDLTPPATGISTVFDTRGYRRVVSCGWCMNLDTKAATQYSGYDFTATSGGYGTAADGIYQLEGEGKVDASVGLGKIDFGSENEKALPAAYLGSASEHPLILSVNTPRGVEYHYSAASCSDTLDVHRVVPGRGLRANWFDLSVHNADGADFTLASVSFAPAASTRRI